MRPLLGLVLAGALAAGCDPGDAPALESVEQALPCTRTLSSGAQLILIANANPGGTICLNSGTYAGGTLTASGVTIRAITPWTARITSPINIQGWNNTLDGLRWSGTLSSAPGVIGISGQQNRVLNCKIENLQSADGTANGIWVGRSNNAFADAHNTEIAGNLFSGWGPTASCGTCAGKPIIVGCSPADQGAPCSPQPQFSGTWIHDNTFTAGPYGLTGYNAAIATYMPTTIERNVIEYGNHALETKGHNQVVRANEIRYMSGNALGNRGGYNSFYEGNYVHHVTGGSSAAVWVFGGWGIVFRNNLVAYSDRAFFASEKEPGGIGAVQLVNNTFYGNSAPLQFEYLEQGGGAPGTAFEIVNNIFVGTGATQDVAFSYDHPAFLYVPGSSLSVIRAFTHNLFGGGYTTAVGGVATAAPVTGAPAFAGGGGPAAFLLTAASAARDAATSFQNVPSTDYFGAPRPRGPAVDLGAAEY